MAVGFDGGGHGDFLWDQLPLATQMGLSRLEITLPKGFDIFARFDVLARENDASLTAQARSKTIDKIRKEIEDCARAGAGAAQGSQERAERFAKFVGRKIAGKILLEGAKAAGRAAIAAGVISDATLAGRAISWASNLAPIGPAGVATLFLQMSYYSAPTNEELESERRFGAIKRKCAKAISKKYGLQ